MSTKPVEIEERNISRQEQLKQQFPPGLLSRQSRVNYALSMGLDLLEDIHRQEMSSVTPTIIPQSDTDVKRGPTK